MDPVLTHHGHRYVLGYGEDHYAIWERDATEATPLERYPRTDEGWQRAWYRFQDLEAGKGAPTPAPAGFREAFPAARSLLSTSDDMAVSVLRVVGWVALIIGIVTGIASLVSPVRPGIGGPFSMFFGLMAIFQGVVIWAIALVLASMAENLIQIRRNTERDSRGA